MTGISPNARALLDAISFAEGTSGANGYSTMFGGGQFDWRQGHPNKVVDGGRYKSAAAGRYQFMPSTWSGVSKQLGLQDFSPQSQDLAALQLIRNRGVDPDRPMTPEAWAKLAPEWASIPTLNGKSYYGQPVKSLSSIAQVYQRSLGGGGMSPTEAAPSLETAFTGDADRAVLTPAREEPSSPLSAMVAALAQRSLDDAADGAREPGRMALGSGAQAAVIEALFPKQQVSGTSAPRPSVPTEAEPMAVASGGEVDIVRLGQKLKNLGLTVREHPEFGGVGKHSPNSHHYAGNALDLTIQPGSPLLAGLPDSSWRDLTRQYGAKLKQAIPGAEIFHPGDDPVGGHDSHIHLALPSGRTALTEPLMRLLGA